MKALILAAGYATRLYPLTQKRAKPLLPVGDRPILDYIVDALDATGQVRQIMVVSNHHFVDQFKSWREAHPLSARIHIVDDGSRSSSDRRGAIGDIDFVIQKERVKEDLLVVAGDNLFRFGLSGFLESAQDRSPHITVGVVDIRDRLAARRFGIVTLGDAHRVTAFFEKPVRPPTSLVAIGLYYFPKPTLPLVRQYLKLASRKDEPGHYIHWLVEQGSVYGFVFKDRWYDIGDLDAYEKATREYGLLARHKGGRHAQGEVPLHL